MRGFGIILLCAVVLISSSVAAPVADSLRSPDRLEADLERDKRSRPDVTLALLNLQPGDRVADIWAGGGYYSELIGRVVGEEGEVLLINNEAYKYFARKGLQRRLQDRVLTAVTMHDAEAENLRLGEAQLDAAVIILSYHDLYHVDVEGGWRAIDPENFLGQIYKGLKPGGRFLVVDHHAAPGTGSSSAQDLHRIDVEFAKRDIAAHGFRLVATSDVLRNRSDDYQTMVFRPEVRGKTDRFILVFEKPHT